MDEQQSESYLAAPYQRRQNGEKKKETKNYSIARVIVVNTAVLTFKVHMGWAPQLVSDLLNRAPA